MITLLENILFNILIFPITGVNALLELIGDNSEYPSANHNHINITIDDIRDAYKTATKSVKNTICYILHNYFTITISWPQFKMLIFCILLPPFAVFMKKEGFVNKAFMISFLTYITGWYFVSLYVSIYVVLLPYDDNSTIPNIYDGVVKEEYIEAARANDLEPFIPPRMSEILVEDPPQNI